MIALRKLNLNDEDPAWFLVVGTAENIELIDQLKLMPFPEQGYSNSLYFNTEHEVLLKAACVRNPIKDTLAKLAATSPAWREAEGNAKLRNLGFNTPNILAKAVPINPFNKYRSWLYCSYLTNTQTMIQFLKQNTNTDERHKLLAEVAKQLTSMLNKGIYFRDMHLGNILLDADRNLTWIDTEVKDYSRTPEKAWRQLHRHLDLIKRRFTKQGCSEDEVKTFLTALTAR